MCHVRAREAFSARPSLPSDEEAPRHRHERLAAGLTGRTRSDLDTLGISLVEWMVLGRAGFHMIEWTHAGWCPLHCGAWLSDASTRCECDPDATLLLDVGTPHEQRISIVSEGIPLGRTNHV